MRLVQRRAKLIIERERIEKDLSAEMFFLFRRQKSVISRFLRKSNLRKRLGKIDIGEAASAEDAAHHRVQGFMKGVGDEGWSTWKTSVVALILSFLKKLFLDVVGIEGETWEDRGYPPFQIDFNDVVRRVEARTGKSISYSADNTIKKVEEEILSWYMSDRPFADLMDSLDRVFGEARARTISADLAGELLGQIVVEIMANYGWDEWYWDAMGEDPCSSPIIVMNGVAYDGCLALHGKKFNIKDATPPGASHPNCHCLATPIPKNVLIS